VSLQKLVLNLNKKNTEVQEFRSSGVQEFRRILNLVLKQP